MDDPEREEESPEEDLRNAIMEQLASMENSDVSDEESYRARLSCILEDDESESSGQSRNKDLGKNEAIPEKMGDRDKTESPPPQSEEEQEGESDEDMLTLREDFVLTDRGREQVTDLDEISLKCEDEVEKGEDDERRTPEDVFPQEPFEIKKFKSSNNVFEKRFVPKRTELSSDSSDIDISISNEKSSTVEGDTTRTSPVEEETDTVFAKVSKTYAERAKSMEERSDGESRVGSVERELARDVEDPKMILQVVQLRSKSPRVYTPPVPPETYLWEELKRIRGKGGYPWTYLDKPPFDEAAWKKYMEHEYEPINPPPLSVLRKKENERESANEVGAISKAGMEKQREAKSLDRAAKEDVKTEEDMEIEDIAAAQELQDQIENRFLAQTPTTTASRTDADVNTSMLDSSGLEDVPLKRTSRSKTRNQAHVIQQKLRSQAGKIRNKIRNIPKPSLKAKERQKDGTEKPRFKLPERPKFSLPDRSKFTLPQRPKFKLPDKSKFTLPERPKFNFPERPKLHLPERPKFSLPEMSKFHLPERPKLHLPERPKLHLPERPKLHLPERPKLHLPERPKFHLPERPKFHLPERPKLHLPERPKINMPSFVRPLRERQEGKNIFDLDIKSYPKIFTKKSKQEQEYITSSPKKTRGSTPPPKMRSDQPQAPQRKKVPVGQRWLKKMDDIKFADEGAEVKDSRRSDRSESVSDFRDKDLAGYMEDLDDSRFPPGGSKTLSTKSSLSHMSDRDEESMASSEGRRKGVLEEIDSDEFFLRQKGISQEDIDMGKYLSHEIREAFRSPEVNALARMDYDFDEIDVENEPPKPARTRSLKKKSNLKKRFESDPSLSESGYKTYPPRRPNRKSRSQSKSLVNEEAIIGEPMYENDSYREDNVSEYYKSPKEYEHYKVPRPIVETTPVPYKRKKAGKKNETSTSEEINQYPPQPLTRKKSKKLSDGKLESLDDGASRGEESIKLEQEFVLSSEAPIVPRRTRSLTRSIRSSTSFHSEGLEESREALSSIGPETQDAVPPEVAKAHHYEMTEDDPGFGYATIGKPIISRPTRQKKEKPQRPPPPRRKKDQAGYHTFPRKTPVRPLRNYSTLGPSRPPRKSKPSERLGRAYVEIESESIIEPSRYEECQSSNLHNEEVIEKMKGRPLPPPPRPPRSKSKGSEGSPEPEETQEEKISIALLKGEAIPVERVEVEALVHSPPSEPVEEVCVSTQTDPLPEDFLLDVEEDIIQEFSHEQLKIQQAFLQEMEKEAAKPPRAAEKPRQSEGESTEDEKLRNERLEMELLAQLERDGENNEKVRKEPEHLEPFDLDLGYASLDRRQHKQEPEPSTSGIIPQPIHVPVIPDIQSSVQILRTDKLDVKELEVERLNVKEMQAQGISTNNLQTGRLTADEVTARSGNLALDNIRLPPDFIRQIVDEIPWSQLRGDAASPTHLEEEAIPPARRRRRRTPSFDEGEDAPTRREATFQNQNVAELSKQLATACAASGVRAIQGVASRIQNVDMQDKGVLLRAVLCIVALLVAAFLLLGSDRETVLHHHWDFYFPPQPPPPQL